MKTNKKEITETKTTIIEEYIAADGSVFRDKEECKRYEESALFAVKSTLKKLNSRSLDECEIFGAGCGDTHLEIYDIQTTEDLMRLKMYCRLLTSEGVGCSLEKITLGHEVAIFFSYDYCWTYADGSIEGILNNIRENFKSVLTNKQENNNEK